MPKGGGPWQFLRCRNTMRSVTLPHNLRDRLRALGVLKFSLFVLQRLLAKSTRGAVNFHLWHVFVQPVRGSPLLPERWRTAFTVRPLALSDADRCHDENSFLVLQPKAPLGEFRARLGRGDICLAVFRADRIVGHIWLCFDPFEESEVRCRFVPTPGDCIAWDSNLYIAEHERGSIALAALWDAANALLRERGLSWTASQTSAFNAPSLRANEQLGARRVGSVLFCELGPCQLTISTMPPHIHLSLGRSSAPEIAVAAPDA